MSLSIWMAAVIAALAVGIAARLVWVWARYRGARIITCPENRKCAGVEVDAAHAAATLFHPELRLSSCSRWPERQGCGQECLSQVAAGPGDCLVRNVFGRWYEGKPCVYCRKEFSQISWAEQKPGLLCPDGTLTDWGEIPAEQVPETLLTAMPVCFSCYAATRFAKDHPGLVVDRSR